MGVENRQTTVMLKRIAAFSIFLLVGAAMASGEKTPPPWNQGHGRACV